MFKKQPQNKNKKSPHVVWDFKRYKSPNHFEGMIMKGFIAVSSYREHEKDFVNLIKLYKNDIYNFSFDGEDSVEPTEIPENTVPFITTSPLIRYADVWVAVSNGGISGLILLNDKVPSIWISESASDDWHNGRVGHNEGLGKHLKTIPFIDFKTTKFKRITMRERDSLLNKMKSIITRNAINYFQNSDELDYGKFLSSLDPKTHMLLPSDWNGDPSSIVPIDFIIDILGDKRTTVSVKEGAFNTLVVNGKEIVITQLKPLNNKQAIDLIMKGTKHGK